MNQNRITTGFFRIDVCLMLCVLGLMLLGVAFIYSSGVTSEGVQVSSEWIKQTIWSITGLILMTAFSWIDYQRWRSLILPLYAGFILTLILVLMVGTYVKGARAWLGIGGIGIQPSEFGKVILIIMLAWWYDERGRGVSSLGQYSGAIIITSIPVILILLQPDLGTAFVYIPILFTISFFADIRWNVLVFPLIVGLLIVLGVIGFAWDKHVSRIPNGFFRIFTDKSLRQVTIISILVLAGLAVAGWIIFYRRYFLGLLYLLGVIAVSYIGIIGAIIVLHGYQMMRFVVFLNPQIDPLGAGWHIIQSLTAVGSGGLRGKGFLQGTQSHYQYLPEQNTDFIFSILAEETGFLGGLIIFILFSIIIIRSLHIAYTSQDKFGTYIAVGIVAMIGFHVIENIGMSIGVMPITGIPLFFLSYGGSSLWTALISIGLLLSIHIRRRHRV